MKKPPKFSQLDVSRALKGALASGLEVKDVRFEPDGTIVLSSSQRRVPEHDALGADELDARLEGEANGEH